MAKISSFNGVHPLGSMSILEMAIRVIENILSEPFCGKDYSGSNII
jgi:hypothetical protein